MRSGLNSSLLLTVSRRWFLLVRLGCMAISTGLCHRLSKSSMGLAQSFPSKRGGKGRQWPGSHFTEQKSPVPGSSGASLAKRPYLESRTETHPCGKKSPDGSVSTSSTDTRSEGAMGVSAPDVLQSSAYSSSSSVVFQVDMLSHFLDQWEKHYF